ncbi:MAG TPA: YraN family protein [Dictyobacter sp.]|jgi:putative endonuclease|nr:YraN family protein [Dictyobacter sp.]
MDRSSESARITLGRLGERLAAEHLQNLGYCIRELNFRCRYGEIDIIAEHEQDLVFIEVKTRRGCTYGIPEEAVTRQKLQHIIRVALYYLDRHSECERAWRVDVVALQFSTAGGLETIRVHPHVIIDTF